MRSYLRRSVIAEGMVLLYLSLLSLAYYIGVPANENLGLPTGRLIVEMHFLALLAFLGLGGSG
jgi:hypothetical protein